jgi:hypothetical protein
MMKRSRVKTRGKTDQRPRPLDGAALRFEPQNELGVVYLFASMAKRLGLSSVEIIRPGFPDCVAYQRTGRGEKKVQIEFEYRARNFNHDAGKCDWLVCWENNWPNAPKGLRIVELRRYFGLGVDVWIQPVSGDFAAFLAESSYSPDWSVASLAKKGDLVLFYRTAPDSYVSDLFKVDGKVSITRATWRTKGKSERDYSAPIRRVATLLSPIHYEDFQRHSVLKHAPFMRARLQGRPNVTEYWPYIYDMIIRRNHNAKRALSPYEPR